MKILEKIKCRNILKNNIVNKLKHHEKNQFLLFQQCFNNKLHEHELRRKRFWQVSNIRKRKILLIWLLKFNFSFPTLFSETFSMILLDLFHGLQNYQSLLCIYKFLICCVVYWCEKTRKCMSRWTGRRDITEKLWKNGVKPQSINQVHFWAQSFIVSEPACLV